MGNPNANSLEGQASEPEANLNILLVTLALGLADHTWVEKTIEIEVEVDPEINPDLKTETFDAEEDAFQKWMRENEEEANRLAPSFYKLIHWEWKN